MKKFYHTRCQHSEDKSRLCEKCHQPKNGYRFTDNQILIRNIQEFESRTPPMVTLIDNDLKRHEIIEVRYANEENLIYELSNRNFHHLQRAIDSYLTAIQDRNLSQQTQIKMTGKLSCQTFSSVQFLFRTFLIVNGDSEGEPIRIETEHNESIPKPNLTNKMARIDMTQHNSEIFL